MNPLSEALSVFSGWVPYVTELEAQGADIVKSMGDAITAASSASPSDLMFTVCDPMRKGHSVRLALGTSEGNSAFLSGRINPGFRVKPSHLLFLNPTLTLEEATELHKSIIHPANPVVWRLSGLPCVPEGPADGLAHPQAALAIAKALQEKDAIANGVRTELYGFTYLGVPSQSMVFDVATKKPLAWDLLRYSYMSASDAEFSSAMDADTSVASIDAAPEDFSEKSLGFADDVYEFVKSKFPLPGAVVPFDLDTGEVAYARIGQDTINFVTRQGHILELNCLGKSFSSVSLVSGQEPGLLFAVTEAILKISTEVAQGIVATPDNNGMPAGADMEDDYRVLLAKQQAVSL